MKNEFDIERLIDHLVDSSLLKSGKIKTDSRKIIKGDIFIAIRGNSFDGHDFIDDALRKGANIIIYDSESKIRGIHAKKAIFHRVVDTKEFESAIVKKLFGSPCEDMTVFGVTGTNGKTTTATLIQFVISNGIGKCGLISTVRNITDGASSQEATMTTPDNLDLLRYTREMADKGLKYASIELSSHALHQDRAKGIKLDAAIFTNISPEHMDYHKDMRNYMEAKMRIFSLLKPGAIAVMNGDDKAICRKTQKKSDYAVITFGINKWNSVIASNINTGLESTTFRVRGINGSKLDIKTKLIGIHNVYNILGAITALVSAGIDNEIIIKGVSAFSPVPGRLESIASPAPFMTFIDYAHTPDALEKVLKSLRPLTKKRLICLFGCGGNRDRKKRAPMGRIASALSDYVIITSDNPRGEDPLSIIKQIKKGIIKAAKHSIIENRKEAIKYALGEASAGDVVLIAGKGHESYQIIGKKIINFNDRIVAESLIKKLY